jgi:hypothetical protein
MSVQSHNIWETNFLLYKDVSNCMFIPIWGSIHSNMTCAQSVKKIFPFYAKKTCTDKKENLIFLIYKEIQNRAVEKSYIRQRNAQIFNHIWGGRWSYMTLQLLQFEFPYIWGKFDFLFYHCEINMKLDCATRYFFPRSGCVHCVTASLNYWM